MVVVGGWTNACISPAFLERERRGMTFVRRVSSIFPQFIGFTNRSFTSLKFPGESLDSSTSSTLTHGIHVFHCPVSPPSIHIYIYMQLYNIFWRIVNLFLLWLLYYCFGFWDGGIELLFVKILFIIFKDARGIVAKLSECIASRGGNILGADIFVPDKKQVFYSRRYGSFFYFLLNIWM